MLRFFMFGTIVMALASAFVLYAQSYETRELAENVRAQERRKAKLIRDISVLRAERAYLSRPGRIAKYATDLGMRPARGDQIYAPTGASPARN